jgi:hypothetical protein
MIDIDEIKAEGQIKGIKNAISDTFNKIECYINDYFKHSRYIDTTIEQIEKELIDLKLLSAEIKNLKWQMSKGKQE